MDESLSWNVHVKYLTSKVSKRIGILSHTRRSMSIHTATIIYKSLILHVIIDYCDTVWSCCGSVNADREATETGSKDYYANRQQ